MAELSDAETLRYNRQITLRGFDFDGQEKLKSSRALVVGLGGLGCSVSQYLAAAGVGHLTLLDFDTVSLSNLQRQILHFTADIDSLKVDSAAEKLGQINPHVSLTRLPRQLDDTALDQVIAEHDIVLDCTDNVAIRQQLNRACYQHKVPLVSGAAIRMEGQITVFTYEPETPCYLCLSRLFGETSLTCAEAGVMAPLVGVIGSLQAMEAIKVLCHFGSAPVGKIVMYDAMTCQFRQMTLTAYAGCQVCGNPEITLSLSQ